MIRNVSRIDTTPGAEGENAMFSPPAGFSGDRAAYFQFLKEREADLYTMSWWVTCANPMPAPEVVGPYATPFREAFERVCARRLHAAAAARRSRG